jgi:uncharacterized repeat protein (TIGR03803 family)
MKMRFSGRLPLAIISLGLAWQTPAYAQTFSVLYNFGTNNGDPMFPSNSGITAQGRDGNLYSTTPVGGASSVGAAFKITPAGKLTVQYSFEGAVGDFPDSGLTLGTDGNFYGTTTVGYGIVFRLTPSGNLTVLHAFVGSDGSDATAPPIQGLDGNFYGTTAAGGAGTLNSGTVYKLTKSGEFTSLYSFDFATSGETPSAPLVQGTDGNFYGTTNQAGLAGDGTIFRITPAGELTLLYEFDGTDGSESFAPLIQGSDGNFYGTATSGGSAGYGTVFRITPQGKLTVLHSFSRGNDGYILYGGLVQATDGNFYGTTAGQPPNSCGTIFRITPKGRFSTLYNFGQGGTGCGPEVTLIQHTDGALYGDTYMGGTGNCSTGCGVFFRLNANLPPFVSLLSITGKVGKTIEILGQGFKGTTAVSFNGTSASFKVVSGTYVTATVPKGATTGFVTVTTPKGKLTSNKKFRVN